MIFNEDDVCDILMKGHDVDVLKNVLVDDSVKIEEAVKLLGPLPFFVSQTNDDTEIADWDRNNQKNWHMPQQYRDLDIAQYVLDLCGDDEVELQRVGEELLLYQERNLFDLLRYLKYLVDTMRDNQLIWGVGRGSSVASFILYKLGVHRINSITYKLSISEFLR